MSFFDDTLISKQELFKKLQFILIAFGILCLFSTIILKSKDSYLSTSLPGNGGKIGPLEGETVYHMRLRQSIPTNSWSFIEVSVVTEDEDALFSFGKEFWNEVGHEYGERWQESQEELEYDFTLPEGTFYLNVEVPETKVANYYKLNAYIFKRNGSSMLMVIVAMISLVASGILYLIRQYAKLI